MGALFLVIEFLLAVVDNHFAGADGCSTKCSGSSTMSHDELHGQKECTLGLGGDYG